MKKILLMLALMLPCLGVMAQELPTNCEVSFTNVQQDGKTYTLYITEAKQLALSTESVENLGEDAIFYIEKRPKNKYSLYNKKHKLYMIWRGKNGGYNSDKGVLGEYNSTYCDWSFTKSDIKVGDSQTETYFFASKRSNGNDGTLVVLNAGSFDAYSNAKGWQPGYSNLYTIKVEKTYDYLPEYALLQDAYNEAMANDVGEAVGMYKETMNLQIAKMQVEEVLTNIRNGESDSDSETLQAILDWFKAAFEEATVQMAPGYYYVKGTGTGNNANWYLSHKINNGKECMWAIAPTGKLNADYIWKFETSEDGYKMQCVNIGKYFQMKTATNNGDNNTYLTETYEQGNKMSLENTGSGKFIIKNSASQNVRTENGDATGAQVNYWSGEKTETWYLIPATELEVTISAVGYSTIHLPFDVVLPDGLDAYSVVTEKVTAPNGEKSGWVTLDDSKKSIPANTGAILASESALADGVAKEYKLQIAEANDSWTDNLLRGTNVNTYLAEDAYVLGVFNEEVGLYKAELNKNANGESGESHFLNNANKAYLPNTFGASLVLRFNFGGTTAIESVLNNSTDANAPIYDLSGRRVMNTVKGGIYIQNGKKFIVK